MNFGRFLVKQRELMTQSCVSTQLQISCCLDIAPRALHPASTCTTLIPATPCLWLCSMRHPWTMMFTPLWTQLAVPSLPTCYPPWPGGSPSVLSPPATASTPPRCVSTPRAVPTSSRALVRASPCDAGGRLALAMYTNGQCEIRSPVQNAHCVLETVRSKQSWLRF